MRLRPRSDRAGSPERSSAAGALSPNSACGFVVPNGNRGERSMAADPMTSSPHPARVRDLAKVVDVNDAGCTVQFLDDGRIATARWSDAIRLRGIIVRPSQLVVVAAREPG